MSIWKLATRSLQHFWRTNLALLLGIAIGSAVLTGALIVGNSVRMSLRNLTLERLGRIAEILVGEQFFRAQLAEELTADGYAEIVPAILINQATVERAQGAGRTQGVTVVGCNADFWQLQSRPDPPKQPGADEIVINETLAGELGVGRGDQLILRIGKPSTLTEDSPLARKDDLTKTLVDLTVVDIIPTSGLGRFSLEASQQLPSCAFVALETMQDGLDQKGRINAVLIAKADATMAGSDAEFQALSASLRPQLTDLGLVLNRITLRYRAGEEEQVVSQYDTLTNARMIFSADHDRALKNVPSVASAQQVFTYLATKMQRLDPAGNPRGPIVPYSTITAVDSQAPLGPLSGEAAGALGDDDIVLNSWAAEDLRVTVGDRIRVTYFEPETTYGETVERSVDFTLKAIAPITQPDTIFSRRRDALYRSPPTLANDHHLTPEVKGITDAESINKWDAPFPMDRTLITGRDDDYWEFYRATPKAFVSLARGRSLWQSRFGQTTSYRIGVGDGQGSSERSAQIASALQEQHEEFGLRWIRAKADGLAASRGTTPFDALFFGFSQFIIAAALLLVSLLLRLNMEFRSRQMGLLGALGFDARRLLQLLGTENLLIAICGSLAGVVLGVAYAQLMLTGLRTLWVAAVVVPFLELAVTPGALVGGFALGLVMSLATILFTLLRLRKLSAAQLLGGQADMASLPHGERPARRLTTRGTLVVLPILAVLLGSIAPTLPPEPQAGAFFGAGCCILAALLLALSVWLRHAGGASQTAFSLPALALRNLTRNPTRSALTVGLVAAACFLIIAISAFRLAPTDSGTGGFELVGKSDRPLFSPTGNTELVESGLPLQVFALRLQPGDDASCRNLYQSSRPQLIGLTDEFLASADTFGNMEWAGHAPTKAGASPWTALVPKAGDDAIPVVLDKNTAMYAMQIYGGVGSEFERDYGTAGVLRFRVAGLLSGSIFQGSLIVHEQSLLKHFHRVGGYQYFLVDTAPDRTEEAWRTLEGVFSDEGLDLTDTKKLLSELLAVQNTYLTTFQSLGGLGLLLGTFGLVAVQLRNVLQRRAELALLRACGYRNDQLSLLMIWENTLLLGLGVGVGVLASLVVVLPHMLFGGASLPWAALALTLCLIVITGLVSATAAQRALQRTPLLGALRGD